MHCAVCCIRSDAPASDSMTWLTADAHLLWIEVVFASQAGDELHAVELELQLRSIVIESSFQGQHLSTTVVLIMTSDGD
jgi:hypothetical protein